MLRFIRKRGVSSAISIFLALAAMTIALRNDGGSTTLWYGLTVIFVVAAVVCWFVVPPVEEAGIKVKNSPNATIEGNVSREDLGGGIEVEDSPGADVKVNVFDEDQTNGEAREDGGQSDT